jgi:hypothetical protein
MVYGPYNLAAGDSLKLVIAYTGGHPGQILGGDFYNDGMKWSRSNRTVAQKQTDYVNLGPQAMVRNMQAARFMYQSAYDIPDAPPDVNFKTGSSERAFMTVDWPEAVDAAVHPDYKTADIAGYRVYKSTWFIWGPWDLVVDVPVGTASYEDPKVKLTHANGLYTVEDKQSAAGFFYHYHVRAYQKVHDTWTPSNPMSTKTFADLPAHIQAHMKRGTEGNWVAPTQKIFADESPFQPSTAATDALQREVLVVPNPYYPDQVHEYPASTKMRFVGIPSKCTIRVFTVSGDLVAELDHDDATKGERDYDQITWNNSGELATGVYLFVVENLVAGQEGKLQRGAFMVIR